MLQFIKDMRMEEEGIEGIVVDEVIDVVELEGEGKFTLVLRSGGGIIGLIFTAPLAKEAAQLLISEVDVEGRA